MGENSTVLGPEQRENGSGTEPRMFSLMEVAQETGIAMPILLRYKREHPDRIPSSGSGAQQRFPEEAFTIFEEIHRSESQTRDQPRRGGFGLLSLPRVRRSRSEPDDRSPRATKPAERAPEAAATGTADATPAPPPTPEKAADEASGETADQSAGAASERSPRPESRSQDASPPTGKATLTMKDVADQLGIAYPTIARYVSKHIDKIPHEGEGRQRRFPPEALDAFRRIRKNSKPGRPPKKRTAKTGRKRQSAPAPAPAPAPASRPGDGRPEQDVGAPATTPPGASPRGDHHLLQRIERLEERQQQLEATVRNLRQELERPFTAIVEPA